MARKIAHLFVNEIFGTADIEVEGGITTLEKKVRAIFADLKAALPEGSFTVPPKAQWRHAVHGTKDVYKVRVELNHHVKDVVKALYDLTW